MSRVSYILSYTVVKFCPTVGKSLLASGQSIPRQRKVFVLSSDSLLSQFIPFVKPFKRLQGF